MISKWRRLLLKNGIFLGRVQITTSLKTKQEQPLRALGMPEHSTALKPVTSIRPSFRICWPSVSDSLGCVRWCLLTSLWYFERNFEAVCSILVSSHNSFDLVCTAVVEENNCALQTLSCSSCGQSLSKACQPVSVYLATEWECLRRGFCCRSGTYRAQWTQMLLSEAPFLPAEHCCDRSP